MRPIPTTRLSMDSIPLSGGLDQIVQPLVAKPGTLMSSVNYEPAVPYGYMRTRGYERFDGQTSPSSAVATVVKCNLTATPEVGDTLTIGAATCLFVRRLYDTSSEVLGPLPYGMLVTNKSTTIPDVTDIVHSSLGVIGWTDAPAEEPSGFTAAEEAQNLHDVANVARALIDKPPGSGAIRGVWMYNGVVYAFRDNVGGTACLMYKSTAAGWALVDVQEEISFDDADTAIVEGDILTKGGVTATIRRAVLETGDYGSTNSGRLIITGRTGGSFSSGAATYGTTGDLTLSGASAEVTFNEGGKFEFVNHNFRGQATTARMYGCDGKNRAFEFDGTYLVPISTKTTDDKPTHIAVHRNQLVLSIGSSAMIGSVGDPYRFVVTEGAAEIAVGDTITGFATLPGEALAIATRDKIDALTGMTADDWVLNPVAPENGAISGSIQTIGQQTYMLDDRGITSVAQSQAYGNFDAASLSRHIQKAIDNYAHLVNCSCVVRGTSQYRMFFSNGTVLVMRPPTEKTRAEFMLLEFPMVANVACAVEDSAGEERIFIGAVDGYVYELNRGSSFDGEVIDGYVRLWPTASKSPNFRKSYRAVWINMVAELYAAISVIPELTYGDPDAPVVSANQMSILGQGGLWGTVNWGEFFWSVQDVNSPKLDLNCTGEVIGFTIFSSSAIDLGHTLQSLTFGFHPRRAAR